MSDIKKTNKMTNIKLQKTLIKIQSNAKYYQKL